MSNAIAAFKSLQEKAKAGDDAAKKALDRVNVALRSALAKKRQNDQLLQLVDSGALDHLIVGPQGEEAVSGEEEGLTTRDELDVADDLLRLNPYADQLAHKAMLRGNKHADMNAQAPFMRINPVSVLNGTLGGQQVVIPGGPAIPVVNWVGADDAETTPCTLTLSPVEQVDQPQPGPSAPLRPFAILQFGTRGFSVKAEVDIGKGCQLTVGASSMVVQVALEDVANTNGNMKLSGMLSFLPIVRTAPLTRTRFQTANPVVALPIEIPPFSKNVLFFTDGTVNTLTFQFFQSNGTLAYQFVLAPGVPMLIPIAIANDIFTMTVISTGIDSVRAVFGLSL